MNNILLHQDGVLQMYLNSTIFIDLSDSFENDNGLSLLYKTLKKYNIYNREERQFYNIKENSSFDNLILLFNNALKSLSPRSPIRKKNKISDQKSSTENTRDEKQASNVDMENIKHRKLLSKKKSLRLKIPRICIRI